MTREQLIDAMGLLDEAVVADAKNDSRPQAVRPARRIRRIALLAAALSLLFSLTAYALGSPGGVFSWRLSQGLGQDDFAALPGYERQLGFPVRAVRDFSNGYCFREMALVHSTVQDTEGNPMDKYLGLDLDYGKPGAPALHLSVEPAALSDESAAPAPTQTRELDGAVARYYRSAYKFVPADYEPTAEDKAREAAGELSISYGADSVEERYICSVIFCLEDVRYCLLCLEDFPAGEMLQMAQELLRAG